MTTCIIVDDEPLAREILESYVQRTSELKLIRSCTNAIEAFSTIHKEQIDLIFLDIKMPGLNGVDFIQSLKKPPAVIFTTAYSEYAVTSYELGAVDYLLKPITYERFRASIAKLSNLHTKKEQKPAHAYFKVNGKLIKIEHEAFIYAQSIKDYIIIHTSDGNHITHMTMKYLTGLLPEKMFRRVHRSFIINTGKVTALSKNEVELGKVKIPLGQHYKDGLNLIGTT